MYCSDVRHLIFQQLFILLGITVNALFLKSKKSLTNAIKLIVEIPQFKPEVRDSRERFTAAKILEWVLGVFFFFGVDFWSCILESKFEVNFSLGNQTERHGQTGTHMQSDAHT